MSDHISTISPMLASPRCGAKTRRGGACRSPAVRGKQRCRMHGGALGSGAPRGNRNAYKHGRLTREAIEERQRIQALLGEARKLLEEMSPADPEKQLRTYLERRSKKALALK